MRLSCIGLLALIVARPLAAQAGQDTKVPIPSEVDQQQARKLIDEIYGDEIRSAKTDGEKHTLAKKLLDTAAKSPRRCPFRPGRMS